MDNAPLTGDELVGGGVCEVLSMYLTLPFWIQRV